MTPPSGSDEATCASTCASVDGGGGHPCDCGRSAILFSASGPFMERRGSVKKRRLQSDTTRENVPWHLAPLETQVLANLSQLVAHIAATRLEDGSSRSPGRLFLGTRGSSYEVVCKEPDLQAELVILASTLDDALCLTDLMLGADDTPWQPDRWAQSRSAEKKKK